MISDPTGVWKWIGWLAYIPALAYIVVTGAILRHNEKQHKKSKPHDPE